MVCWDWLLVGVLGRGVRVMHRAATSSVTKYTYPFGYGWLCMVASAPACRVFGTAGFRAEGRVSVGDS